MRSKVIELPRNVEELKTEDKLQGFIRPLRYSYIHGLCGSRSNFGKAVASTYARDLKFYSIAHCSLCAAFFPLSDFKWSPDGTTLGS